MKPKKKINYIKSAEQERQRLRLISKEYSNSAPSLLNLWKMFNSYIASLPFFGTSSAQMNPYLTTGVAPVGGKKLRLLTPQQIKTLRPQDARVYNNAVNRITEKDAFVQRMKSDPQYSETLDRLLREDLGPRYADRNVYPFDDEYGFDPELEWLEYKYGGTDSYPYLYNTIAKRRGLPLMRADGLNY